MINWRKAWDRQTENKLNTLDKYGSLKKLLEKSSQAVGIKPIDQGIDILMDQKTNYIF